MFFTKKIKKEKLSSIVEKKHDTGYVFADVVNDLGDAAQSVFNASNLMQMSYAYARRTAVAALYIQGLVKEDAFQYVFSIFKSVQLKTEQTVDFQEEAGAESTLFLQSYYPMISGLFDSALLRIALNYQVTGEHMSDEELFKTVVDFMYKEQQGLL